MILAVERYVESNSFQPGIIALLENNIVIQAVLSKDVALPEGNIDPALLTEEFIQDHLIQTDIDLDRFFSCFPNESETEKLNSFVLTNNLYNYLTSNGIDVSMMFGPVDIVDGIQKEAKTRFLDPKTFLNDAKGNKVYLYQVRSIPTIEPILMSPTTILKFRGDLVPETVDA